MLRPIGWIVVGAVIALVAWGQFSMWSLLFVLVLPVAYALTSTRLEAFSLLLGYYLAVARGLPVGTAGYYGDPSSRLGWVFWGLSGLVLAAPYAMLRFDNVRWRAMGFVLAMLLVAVPPVGIIGWGNPITAAGLLFPGAGFLGAGLAAGLMFCLVGIGHGRRVQFAKPLAFLSVAVGAFNLLGGPPVAATNWRGVDTAFSSLHSGIAPGRGNLGDQVDAFRRLDWFQRFISSVPKDQMVLLPETVLGEMNPMVEMAISTTSSAGGIFVGGELPQPDGRYANALVGVGEAAKGVILKQSIPVPVTMWQPLAEGGAAADFWGRDGVARLGDARIGALICYEQLLPWAAALRGIHHPQIMLSAKNVWWAGNTSIPNVQAQSVAAFARLFGWQLVSATNR